MLSTWVSLVRSWRFRKRLSVLCKRISGVSSRFQPNSKQLPVQLSWPILYLTDSVKISSGSESRLHNCWCSCSLSDHALRLEGELNVVAHREPDSPAIQRSRLLEGDVVRFGAVTNFLLPPFISGSPSKSKPAWFLSRSPRPLLPKTKKPRFIPALAFPLNFPIWPCLIAIYHI